MQEIGKFIDFLGQDSIREAIPVITAIGGALVVVLRFIFKVIYAQNMNEIDKVFMNRKQRTHGFIYGCDSLGTGKYNFNAYSR